MVYDRTNVKTTSQKPTSLYKGLLSPLLNSIAAKVYSEELVRKQNHKENSKQSSPDKLSEAKKAFIYMNTFSNVPQKKLAEALGIDKKDVRGLACITTYIPDKDNPPKIVEELLNAVKEEEQRLQKESLERAEIMERNKLEHAAYQEWFRRAKMGLSCTTAHVAERAGLKHSTVNNYFYRIPDKAFDYHIFAQICVTLKLLG